MKKSIFISLESIKKSFYESIFVPIDLVKESFYEIDSRTRRNIYIFLWYKSYLEFIIYLLKNFFIFNSPNEIVLHPSNILCILPSTIDIVGVTYLSLRRIPKSTFLKFCVDLFIVLNLTVVPFIYIFFVVFLMVFHIHIVLEMFVCFESSVSKCLTSSGFKMILNLIIALWVLRYILRLWKYTSKKKKLLTVK